jgi:hypothetical protein
MRVVTASALWFLSTTALAAPYAFRATGDVVGVTDTTTLGVMARIPMGTFAALTWSYDDATPDTLPAWSEANYPLSSPHHMTFDVGAYQFSSTPVPDSAVYLGDNLAAGNWDLMLIWSRLTTQTNGPVLGIPNQISWRLTDTTRAALNGVAPPTTAPVIADWGRSPFVVNGFDGLGGLYLVEVAPRTSQRVPYLDVTSVGGLAHFEASALTPRGRVAVLTGAGPGSTHLPGGRCAGAWVPLQGPTVRASLTADAAGELAFDAAPPPALSGAPVVFFDWGTCTVSTTSWLP